MATKVLIYGLKPYTDTWAKLKKAYKGFDLLPAGSFDALPTDLPRYPKLKVLVIACWTEVIRDHVDGLHISETLQPLVTEMYSALTAMLKDGPVRVSSLDFMSFDSVLIFI